jgi:hypothetical protein
MATGKAQGTPVEHGHTPGASDRLASATRIVRNPLGPAHRAPGGVLPQSWRGDYGNTAGGQPAESGPPWGAATNTT